MSLIHYYVDCSECTLEEYEEVWNWFEKRSFLCNYTTKYGCFECYWDENFKRPTDLRKFLPTVKILKI